MTTTIVIVDIANRQSVMCAKQGGVSVVAPEAEVMKENLGGNIVLKVAAAAVLIVIGVTRRIGNGKRK
jgi:hypothetical protein